MLKLKNIRKNNGIISAEYDPENSGEIGNISIESESGEVVETNASNMDGSFPIYLNHAIKALRKLGKEKELPKEKMIMWY